VGAILGRIQIDGEPPNRSHAAYCRWRGQKARGHGFRTPTADESG
jgi:hypothetical protein